MEEKICVIIPVRGIWPELKGCISSILDLDCADYEIIIVDDGLARAGLDILDEFKGKIKVLTSHSRGPSYARNLAAENTAAQFLAFTDSDCIVDKNWLRELLRGFSSYLDTAACGGIQKLPTDATPFEKKVFLFMKKAGFITDYMKKTGDKKKIIEVNHNPSCNV